MIGSRVGSKGAVIGSAVGSGADDEGSVGGVPGVSRDSGSLKYTPANTTQTGLLGLTSPQSIWLPNSISSGDLTDVVGSLTLVAANSPTYQQAVSGWSGKGVAGTPGTTNARFSVAGPDVSTTAICLLWYVGLTKGTTANTQFVESGDARIQDVAGATTLRTRNATNLADTVGDHTGVRALMLMHDPVNSRTRLFTDVEKTTVTFAASTGTNLQISPVTASEPVGQFIFLYGILWTGASAQITDATAKTRLQSLGWTIPWT